MSAPRTRLERLYARWAEGDFAIDSELLDENVIFVVREGLAEPGTWVGFGGMREFTRTWLSAWEGVTISARDMRVAGDSVLVRVEQELTGRTSGIASLVEYFQVWTFRAGRAIRIECIRDRAEALDAAGLA